MQVNQKRLKKKEPKQPVIEQTFKKYCSCKCIVLGGRCTYSHNDLWNFSTFVVV